ncbi:hypothetical protein [Rivularia sp. UHCC 0363]|uniref:hypothetical protein n=1 Tax=Rivularia sp. UHCC 0363 TaxID=3110244 RepID=UPI002B20B90B|nr:hypothetical protein [Rivularia sp. UHCC 0363]MEA5596758.1 hypothetical protein [Rivularia sp. UHCC 0363]
MTNTLVYNYPTIGIKNYSIQKNKIHNISKQKQTVDIFDKSNLLAQTQFKIDIGELGYDFNLITQPEKFTTDSQDEFNQNNPTIDEIRFIVEAKQFVLPLGYTAHFYNRNGVEIGFVPVEINPAGSIQPGKRMYVTIPLILLNTNGQIRRMVIQRL